MPIKLDKIKCSKGVINDGGIKVDTDLMEFDDMYCVASGQKPVGAFNFSKSSQKRSIRSVGAASLNKIIRFANSKNIQWIQTKLKGHYLNTVFYLPENKGKAIALMKLLWDKDPPKLFKYFSTQSIGLLLGYSHKNVQYFSMEKMNTAVTEDELKLLDHALDTWSKKVTEDDLPEKTKIMNVRIPTVTRWGKYKQRFK
jgi:hypothetical protein